ncbi:MAG: glycogen synthase [Sandaracinaceae bacterium]
MRLLFVTPELTPYSGVTPAGDTCWALPKALRGLGHDVTVLSPLYGFIDPAARSLARRLWKVEVDVAGEELAFDVYDVRTAAGLDLLFLGHEVLFQPCREVPLDGDGVEDARRYLAFAHAAVKVAMDGDRAFDRVHGHGWATGLVPGLLRLAGGALPTVHSVHDPTRKGAFGPAVADDLRVPRELRHDGGLHFLAAAVRDADRVTAVSPSAAARLGEGPTEALGPLFRDRGADVVGILGGVDVALWNPATDARLEARYDPIDRSGKARCKAALQRELGLPERDDRPLIGALGPVDASTGLDRLARIASRLLRNDLQLAVVQVGEERDPDLVDVLAEHQDRWPDRVQVRDEHDVALVHRLLAGCDALVAPRVAPGSNLPMRAHRYGTLPIGPRQGAFADAVVDVDPKLGSGNGFLFAPEDDAELLAALQRAVGAFGRRDAFDRLRARAMRVDHSWERAAYHYDRLYRNLG